MSRHGPWTDEDVAFEGAGEEKCLFASHVFGAEVIFGGSRFEDITAGDDAQVDEDGSWRTAWRQSNDANKSREQRSHAGKSLN